MRLIHISRHSFKKYGSDENIRISPIGEWVKKNPPQSNLGEEGAAVVLF